MGNEMRSSGTARRTTPCGGLSLVEVLFVIAILITIVIIALPMFSSAIEEHRAASAAHYLAGRCGLARLEAVKRSVAVGFKFEQDEFGIAYGSYVDGNANGIRTADIEVGTDWPLSEKEHIADRFPGVTFGLHPQVPEIGTTTVTSGQRDPIRIGSSDILTFTPLGTSTSGTLYLRGRGQTQFAVRLFGVTGRTRVLRFEPGSRRWVAR